MIDGHNLIPKIPGLKLSDLDDEQRLIEMVQEYCRIRRKQVELYFDNAQPGSVRTQQVGTVRVKFARVGRSADQEIKDRLVKLGRSARNWTVVTSDRSIQLAARTAFARVMPAEEFVHELLDALNKSSQGNPPGTEQTMSEDDLAAWLKLFQRGKQD